MKIMTSKEMEMFKLQLDNMHIRMADHQDTLEENSKPYWKMQDIKAKIAELMDLIK